MQASKYQNQSESRHGFLMSSFNECVWRQKPRVGVSGGAVFEHFIRHHQRMLLKRSLSKLFSKNLKARLFQRYHLTLVKMLHKTQPSASCRLSRPWIGCILTTATVSSFTMMEQVSSNPHSIFRVVDFKFQKLQCLH